MATSSDRVRAVVISGIFTLSLALVPAVAAAGERPSTPTPLLLWLLSLGAPREDTELRKLDVNSATADALTRVPGLDRRQAMRIIALRPYATLKDLARAGLSARFIERLEGWLMADAVSSPSASRPGRDVAPRR